MKITDGMIGEGIKFERIRRITGYLVGTVDRFNDGKRAEVNDRVKHNLQGEFEYGLQRQEKEEKVS